MFQPTLFPQTRPWQIELLRALARHQALTTPQIAALLDLAPSQLSDDLEGLEYASLISRLPGDPNDASIRVVVLGRRGPAALRAALGVVPNGPRTRRPSVWTLRHDVARNDVGVALELLHRRRDLHLLRWETSPSRIGGAVRVRTRDGADRIPLVADALAVVAVRGRVHGLLVETDRATVSTHRMARKYRGYLAWWREQGPRTRFGLRSIRVLTLVPSEARLRVLRAAATVAAADGGERLLWFALQGVADPEHPERLLAAVWHTAAPDDPPRALFE